MSDSKQIYKDTLSQIEAEGLYKKERTITTPQNVGISTKEGGQVLNFCANNYLGLADNPDVISVAKDALDNHGFGMASVRFICGTQDLHKNLESKISQFFGTDDSILYTSCFDANGGLFETLLTSEDAVISDALNHASIIDGIRLCKAQRYRYANSDMSDLETKLKEAQNSRLRLIATDGVFSMDGSIANLKAICDLADKYNALVKLNINNKGIKAYYRHLRTPKDETIRHYEKLSLWHCLDNIHLLTSTLAILGIPLRVIEPVASLSHYYHLGLLIENNIEFMSVFT